MKRAKHYLAVAIGLSITLQASAAMAGKGHGAGGGLKPSVGRSMSLAKPAMRSIKPAMRSIKPVQAFKPGGALSQNATGLRSIVKSPNIGNHQLSNTARTISNPTAGQGTRNLSGNVGNATGLAGRINPGDVAGDPGHSGRGVAKPGLVPGIGGGTAGSPPAIVKPGVSIPSIGSGGSGTGSPSGGNLDLNGPGTQPGGGGTGDVPPGQIVAGDDPTGELEPANPDGDTGRNPPPEGAVRNPSPDDPFDLPGAGDGLNPDDLVPMQPLPEPPPGSEPPSLRPELPPVEPPVQPPVQGGIGISFPSLGGGASAASSTVVVPVQPVAQSAAADLELLEVRQLDLGDGATLGPAYRVTIRNRGDVSVTTAFDVTILGSLSRQSAATSPRASVAVRGIRSGETLAIDIRLPIQALSLGRNAAGASVPFTWLAAAVNSAGQIQETDLENNLVTLSRYDIAMAD